VPSNIAKKMQPRAVESSGLGLLELRPEPYPTKERKRCAACHRLQHIDEMTGVCFEGGCRYVCAYCIEKGRTAIARLVRGLLAKWQPEGSK
jgi:hypothetical protein